MTNKEAYSLLTEIATKMAEQGREPERERVPTEAALTEMSRRYDLAFRKSMKRLDDAGQTVDDISAIIRKKQQIINRTIGSFSRRKY